MKIDEDRADMEERKEVKVKIPTAYHVKLHSIKVLTGQQLSTTVTEALQTYFDEVVDDVDVPDVTTS